MVNENLPYDCAQIGCTTCGAIPLRGQLKQFDWVTVGNHSIPEFRAMLDSPEYNDQLAEAIDSMDTDDVLNKTTAERLFLVLGMALYTKPMLKRVIETKLKAETLKRSKDSEQTKILLGDWKLASYRSLSSLLYQQPWKTVTLSKNEPGSP